MNQQALIEDQLHYEKMGVLYKGLGSLARANRDKSLPPGWPIADKSIARQSQ
jgi:hypothetical protein